MNNQEQQSSLNDVINPFEEVLINPLDFRVPQEKTADEPINDVTVEKSLSSSKEMQNNDNFVKDKIIENDVQNEKIFAGN